MSIWGLSEEANAALEKTPREYQTLRRAQASIEDATSDALWSAIFNIVDQDREHSAWVKETGPTAVGNYVGPGQLEDLIEVRAEAKKVLRRFEKLLVSTYSDEAREACRETRKPPPPMIEFDADGMRVDLS